MGDRIEEPKVTDEEITEHINSYYSYKYDISIPALQPTFNEIMKQMEINAKFLMQKISEHTDQEILRLKKESLAGWISVKDHGFPDCEPYFSGFCIPAISRIMGFGYLVKTYGKGWSFTTDHKYFSGTNAVTHWMQIPSLK